MGAPLLEVDCTLLCLHRAPAVTLRTTTTTAPPYGMIPGFSPLPPATAVVSAPAAAWSRRHTAVEPALQALFVLWSYTVLEFHGFAVLHHAHLNLLPFLQCHRLPFSYLPLRFLVLSA